MRLAKSAVAARRMKGLCVDARPSCRSEPAIRPSSRPGSRVIEAIIGTDKGLLNERCRPGAPGQRPRIAHTHSQDSGAGMISHNMHTGFAGAHGGNDERATPLGGHAREAQRQHPQRARAGQTHRIGPTHHAFTLHEAPHVTLTAATDAAAARLTLMQLLLMVFHSLRTETMAAWQRWQRPRGNGSTAQRPHMS